MLRGEIRSVDLGPALGSEANKRRPAVIVSNDAANGTAMRLGRGVVTVVPVTSNIERIYPFQVLLRSAETGLERDSKAQAEQVRSVAVERVGERLGAVPAAVTLKIDEALRLHLALWSWRHWLAGGDRKVRPGSAGCPTLWRPRTAGGLGCTATEM